MMRRRSAARMTRLVHEWHASGESRSGFARRHHIPPWTFWYWCRKLATSPTIGTPSTFVPVHVTAGPETPVLDIVFSGGERVQVHAGASAEVIRATVEALRTRC